jgi:hypothetical protein
MRLIRSIGATSARRLVLCMLAVATTSLCIGCGTTTTVPATPRQGQITQLPPSTPKPGVTPTPSEDISLTDADVQIALDLARHATFPTESPPSIVVRGAWAVWANTGLSSPIEGVPVPTILVRNAFATWGSSLIPPPVP